MAQGLLQSLAVLEPNAVWGGYGSWMRTRRPGVPPSERVVGLALRNTLLFQWKNLRSADTILRQAVGLPLRVLWDQIRAPFAAPGRRWAFTRALLAEDGVR